MPLFDPLIAPFGKRLQRLVGDERSPLATEYLDHMERYWNKYQPFACPDFQRQLLADDGKFDSLTWELMLGATLLEKGYRLERSINDNRPDLCIILGGKRIWIECCLPTGGDPSKPNSVNKLVLTSDGQFKFHDVDHDKSVLRCTQALLQKKQQHLRWIEKGVCDQNEPFIIALNGRNLELEIYNSSLPDILRALYAAGDMYDLFDPKDAAYRKSGYFSQLKIDKSETAPISTTFFLEKENSHISGVLFSTGWIMRWSSSPQYCYVENINADNRTGTLFTEFCQTYECSGSQITLPGAT